MGGRSLMVTQPAPSPDFSLSASDRDRLAELEAIVDEGLTTFIRVGLALREIRDRRLYRDTHSTFEGYCQEKWGIGRHYAYRQINAASVVELLQDGDNCHHSCRVPANEAQARPLTSHDPEVVRRAWALAVELSDSGQPTSREVEEAVGLVTGEEADEASMSSEGSVHFSSGTEQWLTPPTILKRVVQVLGEIDLDPCSDGGSSPNVPARHHFTEAEDGLARKWFGRVFMNPPYGHEISEWVEKLSVEFEKDRVEEAVALLPARTDTSWFRSLRPYPRCFLHGRLKFSGHENSAPFPSMTVYLGEGSQGFAGVFNEVGDIYVAVEASDE